MTTSKRLDKNKTNEPVINGQFLRDSLRQKMPRLPDQHLQKFATFFDILLKYNASASLVSPLTLENAASVHFADSIFASNLVFSNLVAGHPLYDVSSGNGFPGLVFAILFPQNKVVILEKDSRKLEYLKDVVQQLKLSNVTITEVDVPSLAPGSVKNLVTRAQIPLAKSLIFFRKCISKGGRLFHMKGDGWANEMVGVPSQVFTFWSPSVLGQYNLPGEVTNMFVVLTDKLSD